MRKKLKKLQARKKALGSNPLIVGIDIGSEKHAAAFLDKRGELLYKIKRIDNTRAGFDYLLRKIKDTKRRYKLGKVHVGFEPTGHYWRNIVYFLDQRGMAVHFIKTTLLKHQRELDDSSQSKNDDRDAIELGMLLREGKYVESDIPRGIYHDLRSLGKHRAQLMGGKTATLQRLGVLLDTYMPGLAKIFWSLKSKGLRLLLRRAPFAQDIDGLSDQELRGIILKGSRRRGGIKEKVLGIRSVCHSEIGLEPSASSYIELGSYLDQLDLYERELKVIEDQMGEVIFGNEFCELLLSIPGIGVMSVATFLGELGNPGNFRDSGEIVSFCGLDPSERSSGKYRSGFRISKRGRYLIRTILYYMAIRVVRWNKRFKSWYERKRRQGNLRRNSCLIIVCIKLVRIIFAMFRDRKPFNSSYIKPQCIKLKLLPKAA